MNLLKLLFAQLSVLMIIFGGLINAIEHHLPVFISRSFRYGKFGTQQTSKGFLKAIEVPKSWFKHFYIYSSILSTVFIILLTRVYFFNSPVPQWIIDLLNTSYGVPRYTSTSAAAAYLASTLLTLQCYRRLYDTQFISVFGKNSRMNLSHYLVGFIHYTGAFLVILAEAPVFAITQEQNTFAKLSDITPTKWMATVVFLWAWRQQFESTKILADLRKKNGQVVSQTHHIPRGKLFEYVSNPHLFCEILMYLALTAILWGNTTWYFVCFWVLSNQIETALLSHWWYQEKFEDYPKSRKALVPFVF